MFMSVKDQNIDKTKTVLCYLKCYKVWSFTNLFQNRILVFMVILPLSEPHFRNNLKQSSVSWYEESRIIRLIFRSLFDRHCICTVHLLEKVIFFKKSETLAFSY